MPKASYFGLTCLISDCWQYEPFLKSFIHHHNSKTSCFGMENLPLTIEKDAFYDTKTSCFAPFVVVDADAKDSILCR